MDVICFGIIMVLVETRRLSRSLTHRLLKMRSRRSEMRCVCKKTKQNKTTQDKKKETQTKHFRWGMWGSNASSQDSCPCKSEVQWTVLMHRNGSRCSHTGSSERWVCWKKRKKERPNPETRGTLDHYPVGPFWQATLPLIITGIFRTTPLPLPQMKVISQHAHNQRYRLGFLSLITHFMNNVLIFSGFRFSNKTIS